MSTIDAVRAMAPVLVAPASTVARTTEPTPRLPEPTPPTADGMNDATSVLDARITTMDATAAPFEHEAGAARRASDDAGDDPKEARAVRDEALDFLRGVTQITAQTAAAPLHRA